MDTPYQLLWHLILGFESRDDQVIHILSVQEVMSILGKYFLYITEFPLNPHQARMLITKSGYIKSKRNK